MESQRQKKIASVLQRDLVEVLQGAATQGGMKGILISVTKVNVTVDLSIAKVYLSIFPQDKADTYLKGIQENSFQIRHDMSQRMKNQLRRMQEFSFYIDDSLDYFEGIEKALNQPDNPIDDARGLPKRQKN